MAIQKITADVIATSAVTTDSLSDSSITAAKLHTTLDLTGKTVTVATASAGDNDTTVASTAFVSTAIANLADSAPSTLNTLNELAAALGDDASFSTTVTNSIATKAPLASPTFTGNAVFDTSTLVVDATNNRVGIGTTSPAKDLEIFGSGSESGILVKNDTNTNYRGIYFGATESDNASYGKIHMVLQTGELNITSGYSSWGGFITFDTNGSERMRINASGKVGIGNSAPLGKLTISNAAGANAPTTVTAANTYLQLGSDDYGASNNGKFMIGFGYTDATNTNSPAYIGYEEVSTSGDTYGNLTFYTRSVITDTAPTERMRIDYSGNVGIGVTPTDYFSGGDNLVVGTGTGEGGITLASSGTNQWNYILFADGTSGDAQYRGQVAYNHSTDQLALTASGYVTILTGSGRSEKMRIDSSGNVGIGTDSPATILHAKASGDAELRLEAGTNSDARVRFGDATDNDLGYIGFNRNSGYMNFSINNTQGEHMRLDSNGDLTVGTSSLGFHFDVSTQLFSTTFGTGGNLTLACSNSSGTGRGGEIFLGGSTRGDALRNVISFRNGSSSEKMRINENGSVMIGTTTNPTYGHKLYAVGASIPDGIAHFRDADGTVALSNAIMSLQFSGDNDATNGYFIYMTDGNGAIGSIQAASGTSVSFNTTSDERLKKNIVDASPQLNIIKSIKVREFDWKRNDHHELGLIAQEIKDIIPNVVGQGGDDETKNPYGVDYGKLTPYLIKAMQEQQTIIDDLKSRIETLEG